MVGHNLSSLQTHVRYKPLARDITEHIVLKLQEHSPDPDKSHCLLQAKEHGVGSVKSPTEAGISIARRTYDKSLLRCPPELETTDRP